MNPKRCGLLGGGKFVLSNFLSNEDLSISYESWDVQLTLQQLYFATLTGTGQILAEKKARQCATLLLASLVLGSHLLPCKSKYETSRLFLSYLWVTSQARNAFTSHKFQQRCYTVNATIYDYCHSTKKKLFPSSQTYYPKFLG